MNSLTGGRSFCTSILQTPLLLLVSALLSFGMWFFVYRVWAPQTEMHFSDLYPRWYGSRELLLHHRDPYNASVTREIQVWAHGHPLESDPENAAKDGDRFAYPLYIAFRACPHCGTSVSASSALVSFPVSCTDLCKRSSLALYAAMALQPLDSGLADIAEC